VPGLANSGILPHVLALYTALLFCAPPAPLVPKAPRTTAPTVAYLDVDLRWSRGELTILGVRPGRFAHPTALPLWHGRFVAIVERKKATLVELSFDFPLLADAESEGDETPEARVLAQRIRKGVTSTTTMRVPLPDGADAVTIWDSATQKKVTSPIPKTP
jgi:hypothetical protein